MAIANQKDTVRTYVLFNPQLELTKKKKPQPQPYSQKHVCGVSESQRKTECLMPTLKCTWFKQTDFLLWQPILQVVAILTVGPSWKHCSILSFWEVASY